MILLITGKSAAGKSTVETYLTENLKYEKVVSTTTRPTRENENDGVDYHFVSIEEFNKMVDNEEFLETTEYNNWKYGISKKELEGKTDAVLCIDSYGLRNLKYKLDSDFISFYIDTTDKNRYIRQIKRGDDIIEVALRSERDKATFQGIKDEVDYIVNNNTNNYIDCVISILDDVNIYSHK